MRDAEKKLEKIIENLGLEDRANWYGCSLGEGSFFGKKNLEKRGGA